MAKNKNRKQGGSQNRAAQQAGHAQEQTQHTAESHESPVSHIQAAPVIPGAAGSRRASATTKGLLTPVV